MAAEDVAPPPSPAGTAPRRPGLVHRHSSQSSHISASPAESHGGGLHRPGHHKTHKHVVGHGRGGRNPSFHRSLSKIKINTATTHPPEDDGPPTPKARHHRRTASSGASTPAAASLAPPSPGPKPSQGMRRNNTSLALPRTASQTALKKNHSSGQLSRLGSSRNVSGHAHKTSRQERPDMRRAYTQPYKRHKSPAPEARHAAAAAVHFNVGSDDGEDGQEIMEGVDDVWTEDSASASPNTTRDNTRNNTRHNSIVLDPAHNPYAQTAQSRPEEKPPDRVVDEELAQDTPVALSRPQSSSDQLAANTSRNAGEQVMSKNDVSLREQRQQPSQQKPQGGQRQPLQSQHQQPQPKVQRAEDEDEDDEDDGDDDDDVDEDGDDDDDNGDDEDEDEDEDGREEDSDELRTPLQQLPPPKALPHRPPPIQTQHARPLDTDLIARRLLEKNAPAPPRVSSISALASAASADPKSLSHSQNVNLTPTGANNTPVVSRFVGPDEGIGSNNATPRSGAQSGFLRTHSRTSSISGAKRANHQTSNSNKEESNLQRNKSAPNFSAQDRDDREVQSPSARSNSGAQTPTGDPLLNNSRTQQKLWLQRGLSNIEASSQPHLPGLLPTGRAQAMRTPQKGMQFEFVDKEYTVVRRFHNTLLSGVERVRLCNGGILPGKPKKIASSTVPPTPGAGANGNSNGQKRPATAKSTRSIKSVASASSRSHRENTGQRAKVSFHTGASPESGRQSPTNCSDEDDDDDVGGYEGPERPLTAGEVARRIWEMETGGAASEA